jgi:hypothetical protein
VKAATYGRIVFALSAVLFGIIAMMWQDADTWQGLYRIIKWPMGNYIGDVLMVVLIAGGLMYVVPRFVPIAEKILAVVLAFTVLVCLPGLLKLGANPGTDLGVLYPIAEQTSMLFAVLAGSVPRVARIALGLCSIVFTAGQWIFFKETAVLVPAWIPLGANFWTIATTVAFGLATIALLINAQARLAAWLEGLMITLFGLLVWVPIVIKNPSNHNDWSEFAINFLIAGAAWLVSASIPNESRSRS